MVHLIKVNQDSLPRLLDHHSYFFSSVLFFLSFLLNFHKKKSNKGYVKIQMLFNFNEPIHQIAPKYL